MSRANCWNQHFYVHTDQACATLLIMPLKRSVTWQNLIRTVALCRFVSRRVLWYIGKNTVNFHFKSISILYCCLKNSWFFWPYPPLPTFTSFVRRPVVVVVSTLPDLHFACLSTLARRCIDLLSRLALRVSVDPRLSLCRLPVLWLSLYRLSSIGTTSTRSGYQFSCLRARFNLERLLSASATVHVSISALRT